MPGKPPPWVDPSPPKAGPLIRGLVALGVLLMLAFVVTRSNANAGIFAFMAVVCFGVALVGLFATGVQRYGGEIIRQNRRFERDLLGGGLILVALLTPWTVPVPPLHWGQAFGWQTPLGLLAIAAMLLVYVRPWRRFSVGSMLVAGTALVAWLLWLTVRCMTPAFAHSQFQFVPIDLLGDGWYFAALAFVVTADGMAARASADQRSATAADVWPFALVPGMGLVRMHYPGRGRLWLAGVAVAVFLLQANAVSGAEFQYFASLGTLPPTRPRTAMLFPVAIGLGVWIGSLLDTRRRLRLEALAGDSFDKPVPYRRPTIV